MRKKYVNTTYRMKRTTDYEDVAYDVKSLTTKMWCGLKSR